MEFGLDLPDDPATQHAAAVTEKPGDRIGRYKLLQKIGEGGCGVVYMAEQEEPVRRRVALKVIKLGMDTKQVIARFEAERQALALMDHPNIAKVLDAGATETGRPFFVMELVKGIPITRYCDENKLSTRERLAIFNQVCQAIQHAHQKGIIHRDIKPSNILIADHDGVPVPKVIDFGIAKATTDQKLTDKTLFTAFEQFIGTPAYMSPEQARMSGLDVDTRSDIYSLGVLLYELLTGKTPFDAKRLLAAGFDEIRRIIREEDPPRPSTRLSTLDAAEQTNAATNRQSELPKLLGIIRGDLDWIVMKTLEKDRNRRYDTANSLVLDIHRYLSNEPVIARPPSNLYRFQKTVRRNKLAFAAGSAVAAVLLTGLGVSSWLFVKERRASQVAIAAEKAQNQHRQRAEAAEKAARDEAKRAQEAAELVAQALSQMEIRQSTARQAVSTLAQAVFTSQGALLSELRESADFSLDGTKVVTISKDNVARVWDLRTGKALGKPFLHDAPITFARFSPDGHQVVTASEDKTARLWGVATSQLVIPGLNNSAVVMRHSAAVNYAQFSPDGLRIATASEDQTARVWDARTGNPITQPLQHGASVSLAQFSFDGEKIATASRDYSVVVWDVASGKLVSPPLKHQIEVSTIQFSKDGQQLLTISVSGDVHLWNIASGKEILGKEPTTANMLQAVYIFHFCQYVTWPSNAFPQVDSPLRAGVLGDNLFGYSVQSLKTALKGEIVHGRRIEVERVNAASNLENFHILFITASEESRLPQILERLKNSSVLTVGEGTQFTRSGGMISFVEEKKKLRLRINTDAAKSAQLEISSKLLKVAHTSPVRKENE